jgi:aquaporin related protein
LAPCIVSRTFPTYHWIYWVGPIAGVFLAALIFKLVTALEYETAQEQEAEERYALKRFEVRKRSSVIPVDDGDGAGLTTIASIKIPAPSKKKQAEEEHLSQPAPPSAAAPQPVANKPTEKPAPKPHSTPQETKEEVAVLPECYAD